ncbi:4107_t:CDS:2 [Rhizophagus irregularis]|nr:4107_t:CDS:2 [Rhizophagus irregularis]
MRAAFDEKPRQLLQKGIVLIGTRIARKRIMKAEDRELARQRAKKR